MSKTKEVLLFIIKGIFVLALALMPGVYAVVRMDPYMFLGTQPKPYIYIPNERFQIPGMARHEEYDTVILGTSMIENFSERYASERLKANVIRLPINASYVTEQKYVLDIALKYHDIKTVLWAVDYRTVDIRHGDIYSKNNVVFPKYMYDENPINDWRYIINHNNFYFALKQYRMRKTGINPFNYFITDREVLNTWNWKTFSRQLIINDYKDLYEGRKSVYDKINNLPTELVKETIDKDLIGTIRKYPNTRFVLFFAPKSILWFKLLDQMGILEKKLEVLTYVVDEAVKLPNVEIYNFQNQFQLTENLDIYLDITHYNNTANQFMIDAIAEKKLLTNSESIRKDNEELINRVRSEEINSLVSEILK